MATVYLARDIRHSRRVALKLLKPELGAVLGVERFLSEIAVTANLQHPNLLPLFDSGEANGLLFYVMPFVEGESLRARLEREKQLPLEEAVRLSVAIAGALDYAHQHGVIHRDLKPENILLQAGQPVIADFGIALAVSNAGGARVTQTGLSLGTPQYMSPEQATGDRAIDLRTDIYSLAAMTYEMLTGEPPHTGSTAQAIIAKLMTEDVRPLGILRRTVPPHVDAAVRHGLEKLAADRFATAGDFALALTGARPYVGTGMVTSAMPAATGTRLPLRTRALVAALAVVAVGGLSSTAWVATRPEPAKVLSRFDLLLPDSVSLYAGGGTKLAISRDGSAIVVAATRAGVTGLYIRRLDDPVAQLIRGSTSPVVASGMNPSFSPDGEWIVYSSPDGLKKIPAVGGTPQTIDDSTTGAASWGPDNRISYTRGGDLWVASAEGRDGRRLARGENAALRWPFVLPNGTHALVGLRHGLLGNQLDSIELAVVSMTDGSVEPLGIRGTNPQYSATGHLLFGRSGGLVFAVSFDPASRKATGEPRLILERVWIGTGGATGFAVADNGTIVSHGGATTSGAIRELVRVDRTGTIRAIPWGALGFTSPRISPDGERIAVSVDENSELGGSVLIVDVATGARQRLTELGGGQAPEWSRDGARVIFLHGTSRGRGITSRAWDRSSPDVALATDSPLGLYELAVGAPGGVWAVRGNSGGNRQIYLAHADSLASPRPFVATTADERAPAISPDGKWLAYASDESDRHEIYVEPLPGPGPRLQVSVDGGNEPLWSRDGRTLYYRGPARIRTAQVGGAPLRVMARDSLFEDNLPTTQSSRAWDIFPDGQSFLFTRGPARAQISEISVVLNWPQLLSRAAAEGSQRN
jgi:serine/threonine protein kinase